MIKYKLVLIFIVMNNFLFVYELFGQMDHSIQNYGIPKSPDVSAFQKYGNLPMNLSSGRSDLEIPVADLQTHGYNLNIKMNYDFSGNKVSDMGSQVGLGWMINLGGEITRQTVGMMDETEYHGFINNCDRAKSVESILSFSESDFTTLDFASQNADDWEPDIFSYRLGNISGKFFLDCNMNIIQFENTNRIIEIIELGDVDDIGNNLILKWKITDENGISYFLECFDVTINMNKSETGGCFEKIGSMLTTQNPSIDSWHLTKIVTQFNDEINFIYSDHISKAEFLINDQAYAMVKEKVYEGINGTCSYTGQGSQIDLESFGIETFKNLQLIIFHRLDKIVVESTNQEIELLYSRRVDLPFYEDEEITNEFFKLDEINIRESSMSSPRCSYKMHYKYANRNGELIEFPNAYSDDLRLLLVSFGEYGENGSNVSRIYDFEYYLKNSANMGFPSRNSFAQDYLGYFNGQVNNNTFLGLLGDSFNNFIAEHFSGVNQTQIRNELDVSFDYCRSQVISNREPDLSSARVNMLYQVNYPTNGSTRFDYEFSSSDSEIKCLRINKITDVDNNGHEMVRRYEYAETNYFFEKKVFSTKVLQNLIEVIPQIIPGGMGAPQCDLFRDWKRINFTYQGISPYFMTLFQGAPVLYNKVIEYNESSIANGPTLYFGKTEYTFSVDDDIIRRIPTLAKEVWFVQEDMSWKRGKLLSKIIYNSSGDIVLKEDYSYITSDDYGSVPYNIVKERQIAGIKIEKIQNLQMNSTNIDISQYFTLEKYYKRSHLCLLEKLTKSTYFDNAIHSIIQEDYEYNSRGLISSKSIRESDGSILKLKYSYPFEYFYTQYSPDERVIGLNGLINTNRFSEPIEIITYKDDKIIGGELNTYKYCAGILAPFERFQLNSSNPLIESSTESNSTFTPSRIESTGGNGYILMKDNFYKLDFVYSKYDLNGNLLQYNNENDIVKSFIWSDQSFFPVAVVANSLENVIAYTSFETTEFGNWVQPFYGTIRDDNNAKTGRKVFQLMGSEAIRKNLPAGEYKLEYYAKSPVSISGGIVSDIFTSAADQYGWILYQKKVSSLSSFDLSLTGYYVIIDEVRLCPFSAQMTTYTYDPLIGMTSQTDENNVTTYYEYDGFGRLNRVLDQDRNVIKQYEYNYSNKVQP